MRQDEDGQLQIELENERLYSECSEGPALTKQSTKKAGKLEIKSELISHCEDKFRRIMELDGISPADIM